MARFNPLTGTIEVPAAPPPKAKAPKKTAAPVGASGRPAYGKNAAHMPQNIPAYDAPPATAARTAAAKNAARLPVATYAALLGAPADHAAARRSRDAFIGWCNARPEHTDWRVAWALYAKPAPAPPASDDGGPVIETPPLRCGLCHEDEVHGGQCQNCGATVIDAPENAAPMPQTPAQMPAPRPHRSASILASL